MITAALLAGNVAHARFGPLIREAGFDTLDNWIKVAGNGNWGRGNGEQQYFKKKNAGIAPVHGESWNNALRFTAGQNCDTGIGCRRVKL